MIEFLYQPKVVLYCQFQVTTFSLPQKIQEKFELRLWLAHPKIADHCPALLEADVGPITHEWLNAHCALDETVCVASYQQPEA